MFRMCAAHPSSGRAARHPGPSESFPVSLIVLVLALTSATACERSSARQQPESGNRLEVVTTVGMLADMAESIGGDCVHVIALMGPGVDPHLYRAAASDVDRLRRADIILFGGLNLEGRMGDVLEQLGQRMTTVAVMESLPRDRLLEHPTYHGHFDPHVWMDPGLWAETIPAVAEALGSARPACREGMAERATTYRRELEALSGWIRASMATIPEQTRALVTAHDAFQYFGRAYAVDVIGIQGVSTEAEASLADLRQIADVITNRRIPALFVETSVNPRNVEAVRAAVHDRGWDMRIGGQLFSDAMGESGTWQGTYVGMLRANVTVIVEALGGHSAPWPEALRAWADRWGLS